MAAANAPIVMQEALTVIILLHFRHFKLQCLKLFYVWRIGSVFARLFWVKELQTLVIL